MVELVILVGPPGSGKSSVGRELADRLGVAFRDTDQDIETSTGRAVSDIFIESGEAAFRDLEQAAVKRAVTNHKGVLALGGGAVLSPHTRELLVGRHVVFLDVGLAEAMRRLEMNRSRPLLLGNVRGQWQALANARRPLYNEVAVQTVVTDGLTPAQVAELIADHAGSTDHAQSTDRAGSTDPAASTDQEQL